MKILKKLIIILINRRIVKENTLLLIIQISSNQLMTQYLIKINIIQTAKVSNANINRTKFKMKI